MSWGGGGVGVCQSLPPPSPGPLDPSATLLEAIHTIDVYRPDDSYAWMYALVV